jgi:hypothetical protein
MDNMDNIVNDMDNKWNNSLGNNMAKYGSSLALDLGICTGSLDKKNKKKLKIIVEIKGDEID